LASIVCAALGADRELELFEVGVRELPETARRLGAALVILEQDDGALNGLSRELLRCCPDVRLLLLARDSREGFVWELRPERLVLGELSIEKLRKTVSRLAHREVA